MNCPLRRVSTIGYRVFLLLCEVCKFGSEQNFLGLTQRVRRFCSASPVNRGCTNSSIALAGRSATSSVCLVCPHTSLLFTDLQCFSVTFWVPLRLLSFGTQSLELEYIPLQGTLQIDLRPLTLKQGLQGIILDYTIVITLTLKSRRKRQDNQGDMAEQGDTEVIGKTRKTQTAIVDFEGGGKGPQAKSVGGFQKLRGKKAFP